MTVVGVVVLLIAAIAFANQSSDSPGGNTSSDKPPTTTPTAPTGTAPVTTKTAGIPKGFAHDEQGAQSAAANYTAALGSDGMFKKDTRHALVDGIYAPDTAARMKGPQDEAYSTAFLAKLGLDANGNPHRAAPSSPAPSRSAPVSRATPRPEPRSPSGTPA